MDQTPRAYLRLPGIVRTLTSWLLAAAGVAGLLLLSGGEAWGWWWLAATCLAATIVRGDRSGVLAALLGALAASMSAPAHPWKAGAHRRADLRGSCS